MPVPERAHLDAARKKKLSETVLVDVMLLLGYHSWTQKDRDPHTAKELALKRRVLELRNQLIEEIEEKQPDRVSNISPR